jgi:GT2 family glycosyltransferase/acetyltransferase-like isoleucine patch superfamily enzyme
MSTPQSILGRRVSKGAAVGEEVRVSALVVTFNSAAEIAACLDALLAQQVGGGHEIVVVDNASTDGTVEVLASYADRVRVVLNETNTGFAAGNNQALALSRGVQIALVNPDCIVEPGCIETLAAYLEDTPGVAMAAALLRYEDGRPQLFARRELTMSSGLFTFTEVGRRLDRRLLGGRHARHHSYADLWQPEPTEPVAVDCPAAACVMVWRGLVAGKLFDERFPLLFNDAELYRRLRRRSYELHIVPAAVALHGYGTSLRRVVRGRMRAERIASLRRYAPGEWGMFRCGVLTLALFLDCLLLLPLAVLGRKGGRDRALIRGTLGGLGLPGGDDPWLVPIAPWPARGKAFVRRLRSRPRVMTVNWGKRRRRARLLRQLRWAAWRARTTLHADISRGADIGRGIVVELRPGRTVQLRVAQGASLRDGVVLRLGGILDIGAGCDVRWGAVLNVKGTLRLAPRVALGRGTSVHADGEQVWGFASVAGEYTTVLDTTHGFDGTNVAIMDQPVTLKPVSIGAGSFLGAGACVMPGVAIGRRVRVGAGSVVTRDLPDGCIAFGSPAKPRG